MGKRNKTPNSADNKAAAKSPNPQEKKKPRSLEEEENKGKRDTEMKENDNKTMERKTSALNLGSKFDEAAEHKYAGGAKLWKNPICGPMATWHNIDKDIKSESKPFIVDELFGKGYGPCTVHNLSTKGKKIRQLGSGAHLTAEGSKFLFKEVFKESTKLSGSIDGEMIRNFGVRLGLTDPKVLFEEGTWRNNGLNDRMDTCAWTGAYLYFGAPWKNAESWVTDFKVQTALAKVATEEDDDDDDDDEEKHSSSPDTEVAKNTAPSGSASKKKVGWTRNMFLSKPMTPLKTFIEEGKKNRKHKKKFQTYMKFRSACITAENAFEQEKEYIKMLHDVLKKIWQIDPDAILYQWNDPNGAPLKRMGTLPKNKNSSAAYVNGAFLRQGQSAWVRMHLGHNKPVDTFDDPKVKEWFRDQDYTFYKEKLQAKVTCKAGWLLGSNGLCLNPRDLEAALEMLPELQGIPLEIRMEAIRTDKGKQTGVKAAHVLTPWDKALKCRIAMNRIYSKQSKRGYPLGKDMRFIPNILDTRFITTPKTKMKVVKSVSKQKHFLSKTQTATSYTIIGLDYVQPNIGKSLREILMSIRSNLDPEKNLFLNVDEHMYTSTVTFLFHEDFTQEAMKAIPAIPVILEAKLGPRVWSWFLEEAKHHSEGYYWDKKNGLQSHEDERLQEILGDWGRDWGSDNDDDKSTTSTASGVSRVEPFKIVTDESGKNQYYDDGSTVGTFKSIIGKVNPVSADDMDIESTTSTGD
jgi:hypothetical protein